VPLSIFMTAPRLGHRASKGDNCRFVPRLWNSKSGMSISPKTGMGQ
jgi:hypothetical protein